MWWARLLNNLISLYSGAAAAATSYESIATVTVGAGGSSSISFSSIPSTYKHLQLRFMAQTNRATYPDNMNIQLNSDSGTNYAYHQLFADGTNTGAAGAATQGNIYTTNNIPGAAWANTFGVGIIDLLDYTNTNKYKTLRIFAGADTNGVAGGGFYPRIQIDSGLWQNTNAITTINLAPTNGTQFNQYSSFALYGVK